METGKLLMVSVSAFRRSWHALLTRVSQGEEIVLTRYGRPLAKVSPYIEQETGSPFGVLSGSVTTHGDIIGPVGDAWDADRLRQPSS